MKEKRSVNTTLAKGHQAHRRVGQADRQTDGERKRETDSCTGREREKKRKSRTGGQTNRETRRKRETDIQAEIHVAIYSNILLLFFFCILFICTYGTSTGGTLIRKPRPRCIFYPRRPVFGLSDPGIVES